MNSQLTAKIWHIFPCMPALQHVQLWMDSFPIWPKWSLAREGVSCAMTFDLDLYLQGNSAMTLQQNCYNMAHLFMSALQHIHLWMNYFHIWPKWSLVQGEVANFMDYIHMWHKYNPWGNDVSRTISRSIGQSQGHTCHFNFWGRDGR